MIRIPPYCRYEPEKPGQRAAICPGFQALERVSEVPIILELI
jgi:hypothetical protein